MNKSTLPSFLNLTSKEMNLILNKLSLRESNRFNLAFNQSTGLNKYSITTGSTNKSCNRLVHELSLFVVFFWFANNGLI